MAGPRGKKPPGMAADPRNGQRVVNVNANFNKVEYFSPPAGLTAPAEAAWEAFWGDRQAQLLTPASVNVLLRWVDALNRYMIFIRRADADPIIETGVNNTSLSINPAYRVAESALRTVEWCERQLGIGTLHATALGLAAIAEARSVQDLNARYSQPENLANKPVQQHVPVEVDDDPRLDLDT